MSSSSTYERIDISVAPQTPEAKRATKPEYGTFEQSIPGGAELELQWRTRLLSFVLGSSLLSLWTIAVPNIFNETDELQYRYLGFVASLLAAFLALYIWWEPLTWKNSNRLLYSDLNPAMFDALIHAKVAPFLDAGVAVWLWVAFVIFNIFVPITYLLSEPGPIYHMCVMQSFSIYVGSTLILGIGAARSPSAAFLDERENELNTLPTATRRLVKQIDDAAIEDDPPMDIANFWLYVLAAIYLTMSLLQFTTSIDKQMTTDRAYQLARHNATMLLAHNSSDHHSILGHHGRTADVLAPLVQKYVSDPLASFLWRGWTVWLASVAVQCISLGILLVFLLRSVIYGSTAVTLDRVRICSSKFPELLAEVSDPYNNATLWQAPPRVPSSSSNKIDDGKQSSADREAADEAEKSKAASAQAIAIEATSRRLVNDWMALSLRWWSARKMINEKYVAVVFECLSLFFTALLLCMLISCSMAAWHFHSFTADDEPTSITGAPPSAASMTADLPLVAVTVSVISLICAVLFYRNAGLVLSLQQKDQTMLLNSVLFLRERFPLVTREDESRYSNNVERLIARMNEQDKSVQIMGITVNDKFAVVIGSYLFSTTTAAVWSVLAGYVPILSLWNQPG